MSEEKEKSESESDFVQLKLKFCCGNISLADDPEPCPGRHPEGPQVNIKPQTGPPDVKISEPFKTEHYGNIDELKKSLEESLRKPDKQKDLTKANAASPFQVVGPSLRKENLRELQQCLEKIGGTTLFPETRASALKNSNSNSRFNNEVVSLTPEDSLRLRTNENTKPEILLEIWEETGVYNYNHAYKMENVFPKGSFAYNVVHFSNRRVLAAGITGYELPERITIIKENLGAIFQTKEFKHEDSEHEVERDEKKEKEGKNETDGKNKEKEKEVSEIKESKVE
jgi:hypothetical protein